MGTKIEIDTDILKELITLSNIEVEEPLSETTIYDGLIKAGKMGDFIKKGAASNSNNILVIDDIGVVTYQLKVMLKNVGYDVQIAKDIFSGLNTFIKANYAFVIMDLFVSTEQEGFALLKETKKIITKNNLDTKIIVITASSKSENKVKCMNGGADIFLKKDTGWQSKLLEIIEEMHPMQDKFL